MKIYENSSKILKLKIALSLNQVKIEFLEKKPQ